MQRPEQPDTVQIHELLPILGIGNSLTYSGDDCPVKAAGSYDTTPVATLKKGDDVKFVDQSDWYTTFELPCGKTFSMHQDILDCCEPIT